jgi:hypothetical protein
VTVQTKSEPPAQACREYEQHHLKARSLGGDRFKQAARAVRLRQFVAKTPIKAGITIPPAPFRNLSLPGAARLPFASNMLMSGPYLMKLAAGGGKT